VNRYQLFYRGELRDVELLQDEDGWWVARWDDVEFAQTQVRTEESAIDRMYEVFELLDEDEGLPHDFVVDPETGRIKVIRVAKDEDVRLSIKRISAEHADLLSKLVD